MSEMMTENTSPLLHDLVARKIFYYLGLRDLKACRQVCLKWRGISHPFLRPYKLRLKFYAAAEDDLHVDEVEAENINTFLENIGSRQLHVAFVFESSVQQGHGNLLADIIDRQRNNIKFLSISTGSNFNLLNTSEPVDVSAAVLGCELKFLFINCKNISISMASVISIQHLYLFNCSILIPSEISPLAVKHLKLWCPTFRKDGEIIQEIVLDDFFKMKNLKSMQIAYGFPNVKTKSIEFESRFEPLHHKNTFTLYSPSESTGMDWSFLNLTVEHFDLVLFGTPMDVKSEVKIRELVGNGYYSIKKLTVLYSAIVNEVDTLWNDYFGKLRRLPQLLCHDHDI